MKRRPSRELKSSVRKSLRTMGKDPEQGDGQKEQPPNRSPRGNNQYGALGTLKCYSCRLKKFRCDYDRTKPNLACDNCKQTNAECGKKLSTKEFRERQKDEEKRERERMNTMQLAESMGFPEIRSPRSVEVVTIVNRITKAALQIRDDLQPFALQGPLPPSAQRSLGGPTPPGLQTSAYGLSMPQYAHALTIPSQQLPTHGQPLSVVSFGPYGAVHPVTPHTWPPQGPPQPPVLQPSPQGGGSQNLWEGWQPFGTGGSSGNQDDEGGN